METIASRGGSLDADPRAVADAAVQAWIRAVSELAPVIGTEGVRALYGRCMALARSNYAWLPPGDFAVSQVKALANLRECLEGRKPTDAIDATTDSLVFLTELLGTMIGEALTMRLLNSAWGHDIPDQTKQELPK
ncbi:MAG: hypothetical protein ACXWAC_08310 [Usitatibacter sp.]